MSILFTVILLGIVGVLLGLVIGVVENRRRAHRGEPRMDQQTRRRLAQLKSQLDSGLLTREEYQAEREKLLRT